ncbi:MAG TPA: ABC transporter permease [Sedimentisphaerales bacterium]|nr:ABC transporter permease [Sedimentisphaerales bacterium]
MRRNKLAKNIWLGVENLLLHKMRSFLTMLGVVFGVGSVVAMLSVGEGASKQALERIRKLGSNNIIIDSVRPPDETASATSTTRVRMSIYGLTYDDYERVLQSFDSVEEVVPVKAVRRTSRLGERAMDLRVVGTTDGWFNLVRRPLLAGRTFTDHDIDSFSPVVVLTEYGARKMLAGESTIGQEMRIGGNFFQVIGIVQSEEGISGNIALPDQDIDAYVPISVARAFFGDIETRISAGSRTREQVELHQMIVNVRSTDEVEATAQGIEALLSRTRRRQDYRVNVPLALLREAEATKRTFNIVLGSIAAISLLVGGIGIMNIMLASVTERIREIGIRRAIGAQKRQIIGQFLVETVVLTTIGGFTGIGVGLLIPWLITFFFGMPTVVTTSSVLLALTISVAVGIIFGLYPAVQAANVDPIIALRHE